MTNSFNKMAGKNSAERNNGTPARPRSTSKLRPMKVIHNGHSNTNMLLGGTPPPRSLPINIINNNNQSQQNGYYHHHHNLYHQQQQHYQLQLQHGYHRLSHSSNEVSIFNNSKQRLSPSMVATATSSGSSPNSTCSSRTSPGLVAGYFAGGKWSDPPAAASLPKPPQHWTYASNNNIINNSNIKCSPYNSADGGGGKSQQTDIASQLKVLLNVQA